MEIHTLGLLHVSLIMKIYWVYRIFSPPISSYYKLFWSTQGILQSETSLSVLFFKAV